MAGTIRQLQKSLPRASSAFAGKTNGNRSAVRLRGSPTDPSLMEAVRVTDSAAPAHATATFRFEYGIAQLPAIGDRPADTAWTVVQNPS